MIPFNRDEVLADMDDAPLRAAERALARVDEQDAEIQRLRDVAEAVQKVIEVAQLKWPTSDEWVAKQGDAEVALLETMRALPAIKGQPHYHDPIECGCELTAADAPVQFGPATEPQYLIWSHHHKAWFGPDGSGYRSHIADAGRYALADSKQWLVRGCGCCLVPEVVVPAPPLVAFESPSGLDQFAKEQIKNATAASIRDGQVNRYANREAATR